MSAGDTHHSSGTTVVTDDLSKTRELFYFALSGISINYCETSAFIKRYASVADAEIYHQREGGLLGDLYI